MDRRIGIVVVFVTIGVLLAVVSWLNSAIAEVQPQFILLVPVIAGIVGGLVVPYDLSWLVTRSSLILAIFGGAVIAFLYFVFQDVQNQTASTIGEAVVGVIVLIVLLALMVAIAIGSVSFMILIGIGALIGGLIGRKYIAKPPKAKTKQKKKSK